MNHPLEDEDFEYFEALVYLNLFGSYNLSDTKIKYLSLSRTIQSLILDEQEESDLTGADILLELAKIPTLTHMNIRNLLDDETIFMKKLSQLRFIRQVDDEIHLDPISQKPFHI